MPHIKNLSARSLQYYVISKKWALDLEFFKFEISFLKQLTHENFVKASEETTVILRQLRDNLLNLERDNEHAFELLEEQSRLLELAAEDIIPEDIDELASKQIHLEYLMSTLTADFRAIKKEVYQVISLQMVKNKHSQS